MKKKGVWAFHACCFIQKSKEFWWRGGHSVCLNVKNDHFCSYCDNLEWVRTLNSYTNLMFSNFLKRKNILSYRIKLTYRFNSPCRSFWSGFDGTVLHITKPFNMFVFVVRKIPEMVWETSINKREAFRACGHIKRKKIITVAVNSQFYLFGGVCGTRWI